MSSPIDEGLRVQRAPQYVRSAARAMPETWTVNDRPMISADDIDFRPFQRWQEAQDALAAVRATRIAEARKALTHGAPKDQLATHLAQGQGQAQEEGQSQKKLIEEVQEEGKGRGTETGTGRGAGTGRPWI